MAKNRNEPKIKLKQADRSGPTQKTLLELAEQTGILNDPRLQRQPAKTSRKDGGEIQNEEGQVGRLGEAILWSVTLTMGYFTLDVLVANQYAISIEWRELIGRTVRAFPVLFLLFYSFHQHPEPPIFLPRLPVRLQSVLHQLLFFIGAVAAGCYLIHVTNNYGYYAVMKQAPPMGILWIWSVIELNLVWAVGSLLCCVSFLQFGGYSLT